MTETLIHNGIFVYWGKSGCQIRVDVFSLYRKKEVRGKRSRVNILTIKTDLSLRVERCHRIYSFPDYLLLQRTTERWPEAITGPKQFSNTEKHSAHPSLFCFKFPEAPGREGVAPYSTESIAYQLQAQVLADSRSPVLRKFTSRVRSSQLCPFYAGRF